MLQIFLFQFVSEEKFIKQLSVYYFKKYIENIEAKFPIVRN